MRSETCRDADGKRFRCLRWCGLAQAAFDTAKSLAEGKNITEALLTTARNQLPGGPTSRAAFDAALALAQGKKLQEAAFAPRLAGSCRLHLMPQTPCPLSRAWQTAKTSRPRLCP